MDEAPARQRLLELHAQLAHVDVDAAIAAAHGPAPDRAKEILARDDPVLAARELLLAEHEGDRITHDILHRIDGGRQGRPVLDSADVHSLASALDDVVDYAEQAADQMAIYGIEAPMEQATQMTEVLVRCAQE